MSSLKPVTVLTSKYLRKVGVPQAIPIGTGYSHRCECSNRRPIRPGKVRFGFIPENWFEFFYPKTGITGPYIFGLGLLNYLFSKEIYVCDHEFYSGLSLGLMCVVAVKKLGPKVAQYCDREIDKFEKNWKKRKDEEINAYTALISNEETEQWKAKGSLLLMQAKKQNIDLQLEAAYREELMKAYNIIKNTLDYEVACHNVEVRINHKHMVKWIVDQVSKELPQDNKDLLEQHKQVLSAMALTAK